MSGDKNFWLSWWMVEGHSAFVLDSPWWVTGSRSDSDVSICGAVRAPDEDAAREIIFASYENRPAEIEFRFVEERPDDWTPYNSRFGKAAWMPEWQPDLTKRAETA